MKHILLFLCSVAIVSGLALPVRVLTTKEAPGVAALTGAYWTTNVQIGTPPHSFYGAIDTQGQSVWITSDFCQPSYWKAKSQFHAYQSSSYTNMVETFDQSDQLGEVEGSVGFDTFIFGQIANRSTVVNRKFGLVRARSFFIPYSQATDLPMSIAYAPGVDGVLGLAGPSGKSFMDDAFNEGAWNADVVTYWLENQWETKDNGTHGVLYYGNYDNLHCNYSYYVQNTDSTLYKFTAIKFYVYGNNTVLYGSGSNRQVILASTSPYITVPSYVASIILSGLGLNPNTPLPATVDCNLINTMRFSFSNAKSLRNDRKSRNVAMDAWLPQASYPCGLNLIIPQPDGTCKLAMTTSSSSTNDGDQGHIELGIPFFRGRCTYLDRSQGKIGFGIPGVRVPGGKK